MHMSFEKLTRRQLGFEPTILVSINHAYEHGFLSSAKTKRELSTELFSGLDLRKSDLHFLLSLS